MTLQTQPRARGGYSLAEMLIVVSIMIMLMAVTLPVAKKVMDGSQTREASRQLNAFLAMARARALQTGRPCGLFLPFANAPLGVNDPNMSGWTAAQLASYWPTRQVTQVFLAEVPEPFSGGSLGAVAKISSAGGAFILDTSGSADANELQYLKALVQQSEQVFVRFNFKGEWYPLIYNGTNFVYTPPSPAPANYVYPHGIGAGLAPGLPFQVMRTPRPVGTALELPRGTCIDMTYSGAGSQATPFPMPMAGLLGKAANMTVLITPDGGVDAIYVNNILCRPPNGSLYFLIGKTEKAGDPHDTSNPPGSLGTYLQSVYAKPEESNLADPNSLWVVVNRLSGQITTAENMPKASSAGTFATYLRDAREAALQGEQMTGR